MNIIKEVKCLDQVVTDNYCIFNGDNVEILKAIPDDSIHYRMSSYPFLSLYTYSNSPRDMGNCVDDNQFMDHIRFLIKEQWRTHVPGRLLSFHCMNVPATKTRDGFIGLKDFRGELIRAYLGDAAELMPAIHSLEIRWAEATLDNDVSRAQKIRDAINNITDEMEKYQRDEYWIYHSEVLIWKDPVIAQQRTKAIGLLHKQLNKDSAMSRQGIPDYLITMRKPGDNPEPITGLLSEYHGEDPPRHGSKGISPHMNSARNDQSVSRSIDIWQRYASPTWMDIKPGDTLQSDSIKASRQPEDERHICPLQLTVIRRGLQLWSNPGDVVCDDFNGIGSTGSVALEMGRKYLGIELKDSYFQASKTNLANAYDAHKGQMELAL